MKQSTAKTHGGKREGAGKPALYGKPMKRINVMLDEETIKFYSEFGNGNLSKGIREHCRHLTTHAADASRCDRIGGCLKENLNDPAAKCKCDQRR